jgi:hypothetical protein
MDDENSFMVHSYSDVVKSSEASLSDVIQPEKMWLMGRFHLA